MKTQHTPGPWSIEGRNKVNVKISDKSGFTCVHAQIWFPKQIKQAQANARLVAAAPELLKACKEAVHFIWEIQEQTTPEERQHKVNLAFFMLRDAIAKAEGKNI